MGDACSRCEGRGWVRAIPGVHSSAARVNCSDCWGSGRAGPMTGRRNDRGPYQHVLEAFDRYRDERRGQ